MNKLNKFFLYALSGLLISFTACTEDPVEPDPLTSASFEDLEFPEDENVFYGQDLSGENLGDGPYGGTRYGYSYTSGNAIFNLSYTDNEPYSSWSGAAYSKQTDKSQQGTAGQFVAIPGKGANNSTIYGIMHGSMPISFDYEEGAEPVSIQITNNAYVYYSLLNGDQFAKKFGGTEGTDEDYFKLIIIGLDAEGNETGRVDFYLADYRFENSEEDYIVNTWEEVDLSSLGTVSQLSFAYESTDVGEWGVNTPLYFSFDNLVTRPADNQ